MPNGSVRRRVGLKGYLRPRAWRVRSHCVGLGAAACLAIVLGLACSGVFTVTGSSGPRLAGSQISRGPAAAGSELSADASKSTTQQPERSRVRACHSAALHSRLGGVGGGGGADGQTVIVTNRSATTCTIKGFPALALYERNGDPMKITRTTNTILGSAPVRTISVAPGETASFLYVWGETCSGPISSWPTVRKIVFGLPRAPRGARWTYNVVQPICFAEVQVLPYEPGTSPNGHF